MRSFILGTDCDDAVALRLLSRAVKSKKINLLGIIVNGCMEYSVPSIDGFLQKEEVTEIPLGIDLEATDFGGNPPYQKRLANYARSYLRNEDAKDAVRLYRRLLAQAKEPIELIEIGYMQALASLLKSGPDDISEKSGVELVAEKVQKVWAMAGKWDKDGEKENNFCRNSRSRVAGSYLCKYCPVPITFLGFEVGETVITGGELKEGDWLYEALCDHGSDKGRSSWDPMLVQLALTGNEAEAGYDVVVGWASVNPETGANFFQKDEKGLHRYVVKKFNDGYYANIINQLIKQ